MIHPITGTYFEHLRESEMRFLLDETGTPDPIQSLTEKRLICHDTEQTVADSRLVDLLEICVNARFVLEVDSYNGRFHHAIYLGDGGMVAQSTVADDLFDLIALPDIGTLRMLIRDDLMLRTDALGREPAFSIKASDWKKAVEFANANAYDSLGEILHLLAPTPEVAARLWGALSSPVMTTDIALTEPGSGEILGRYSLLQGVDDFWVVLYPIEEDIVTFTPGSALAAWKAFNALLGILDCEPVH